MASLTEMTAMRYVNVCPPGTGVTSTSLGSRLRTLPTTMQSTAPTRAADGGGGAILARAVSVAPRTAKQANVARPPTLVGLMHLLPVEEILTQDKTSAERLKICSPSYIINRNESVERRRSQFCPVPP